MKYRSFYHLILTDALLKGKLSADDLKNAILIPQIIFNESPLTYSYNNVSKTFPASRKFYYENALNASINTIQPALVKDATAKVYKVLWPYLSNQFIDPNASTNYNRFSPFINQDGTFPTNTIFLYLFKSDYLSPNNLITLTINPAMTGLLVESVNLFSEIQSQSAQGNNQYEQEIENELNRIKELNNQAISQLSSEREKFANMKQTLESAIELARSESFNLSKKLKEMNEHYLNEIKNRDIVINELLNSGLGDLNDDPVLTMALGHYPTFVRYYIMQSAFTHPEYFTKLSMGKMLQYAFHEVYNSCRFYEASYWWKQFLTNFNYTVSAPDLKMVFPNDLEGLNFTTNNDMNNYKIATRVLSRYIYPHKIAERIEETASGIENWRKANAFNYMSNIVAFMMNNQESSLFISLGLVGRSGQTNMGGQMTTIYNRIKELVSQSANIKQDLELVRINTEISISEANKKRMAKLKEMNDLETATKEAEMKWLDYQNKINAIENEIYSLSESSKHLQKTLLEKQGLVSKLTALIGL